MVANILAFLIVAILLILPILGIFFILWKLSPIVANRLSDVETIWDEKMNKYKIQNYLICLLFLIFSFSFFKSASSSEELIQSIIYLLLGSTLVFGTFFFLYNTTTTPSKLWVNREKKDIEKIAEEKAKKERITREKLETEYKSIVKEKPEPFYKKIINELEIEAFKNKYINNYIKCEEDVFKRLLNCELNENDKIEIVGRIKRTKEYYKADIILMLDDLITINFNYPYIENELEKLYNEHFVVFNGNNFSNAEITKGTINNALDKIKKQKSLQ